MNNPLISIIVPIYNVEKYLSKCIDSIINQTLENIEIILVNDGSTDSCAEIIESYANKDNRIKVIHKKNGGQSSARNMGLDIAKGEYIGFVDSDDWLHYDMYENMYKSIKNANSDMCVCGREEYSEDGKLGYQNKLIDEIIDLDKYDIKDYISNKLFYKHTVVVWNKIYKREIIKNNMIRFEDVSYVGSEDALFNYQYLMHAKIITSINKIGYSQLSRMGSTATTYRPGYMKRTSNMIECMYKYSKKIKNMEIYNDISIMFLLFFYQWNIYNIKSVKNQDTSKAILDEIKSSSDNEIFMKCVKRLAMNNNINQYMQNMGFGKCGIYYIKIIMMLYSLKRFKLATRVINFK